MDQHLIKENAQITTVLTDQSPNENPNEEKPSQRRVSLVLDDGMVWLVVESENAATFRNQRQMISLSLSDGKLVFSIARDAGFEPDVIGQIEETGISMSTVHQSSDTVVFNGSSIQMERTA